MSKTITLREANQGFSRCIREVEAGEEITITRRGEPVARIVPVRRKRVLTPEQEAALKRLEKTMKRGWHLAGIRVNRDELYEERIARYGAKRRR